MTTPDDLEAKAARREERQARRQARRREHEENRPRKPYLGPLYSERAANRMTEESHEPPAPHVRYTGWGLLSPFERTKLPRRRDVKVTVVPQSQRRPWLYAS
jgi:hypothetical protein